MATWNLTHTRHHLLLCNGGSCKRSGAEEVTLAIREELARREADSFVHTTKTMCNGRCEDACNVVVYPDGNWYNGMTPELGRELVRGLLDGNRMPLPERISYNYEADCFAATGSAAEGISKPVVKKVERA